MFRFDWLSDMWTSNRQGRPMVVVGVLIGAISLLVCLILFVNQLVTFSVLLVWIAVYASVYLIGGLLAGFNERYWGMHEVDHIVFMALGVIVSPMIVIILVIILTFVTHLSQILGF